jgi:hypothetical protein
MLESAIKVDDVTYKVLEEFYQIIKKKYKDH